MPISWLRAFSSLYIFVYLCCGPCFPEAKRQYLHNRQDILQVRRASGPEGTVLNFPRRDGRNVNPVVTLKNLLENGFLSSLRPEMRNDNK